MTNTTITYKQIWKIAFPIIIGLVAQNLMVVIDTAFLGRLGEVTLGAAAIGGIFYLCMVMLGTGFAVGTQILIGRRNGEKRHRNIGRIFDHSLYVMGALALIVFLFLSFGAPPFLKWFLSSEAVTSESLVFIKYRRFGIFFGFLNLCFHAFYIGITRTMLLSISTTIMALVNIVLDYTLIFGHFGFPPMGIAGAAIATNIAEFVTFLFFVGWSWKNKYILNYRLFRFWKPHKGLYVPLFRLAFPVMFQYFLAFAAWFVFFMIIEQISETALAASNITRSIYMLLMIPVWGLSSATNTLVSNTIGKGLQHEVMPLIKKIVLTSLVSNLLVIQLIIFFPRQVILFFTNDPVLVEATIPLLHVISFALFAFSMGIIVFNGLSGTGKTMVALRIELASIGIYLVCAFILASAFNASAAVVWSVEVIYFSVMGLLAFIYLHKGKWMNHAV
jgi:putative MATE family efflux protein